MLLYDITDFLVLFISCIGIFLASAFFYFYSKIQGLKKSPGDIYFGMCFGEIIFVIHAAIYSIINLEPIFGYTPSSRIVLCYTNLIAFTFGVILIYAYTIQQYLFMIFKLLYSLQSQKIKNWLSHALTWTFALLYSGTSILTYDLYGCGRGSLTQKAPFTFIILLFSFYAMAVTTQLYIRDQVSQHSGEIARKHGQFFQEYIARLFAGQATLMTCFITFSMIVFLLKENESKSVNQNTFPYAIEIFTCLGELSAVLYPVVVPILRFTDPFLRKNLKEYYIDKLRGSQSFANKDSEMGIPRRSSLERKLHQYLLDKNQKVQEMEIELQEKLKKSGLSKQSAQNAPAVQISVTDPFIEQFQISRRSEIIEKMIAFILLSEKNKLNQLKIRQGINIFQKKNEDVLKEQLEITIEQKIFEEEFPDQFADKVNEKYQTKALTMTCHNPEMFQILIKKDFDQVNISDSLDMVNNEYELKECAQGKGGKSGEFFFFNYNRKLLLKSVTPEELNTLTGMLEGYFWHCEEFPNTTIAKIFGIYTFEGFDIGRTTLIIMKNIAKINKQAIMRTYDLKGSTYDRQVLKNYQEEIENPQNQNEPNQDQNGTNQSTENKQIGKIKETLKDIDFDKIDKKLNLSPLDQETILRQLNIDTLYLKQQGFMDYSLCIIVVDLITYFKAQYPQIDVSFFKDWEIQHFKPKQHCYRNTKKQGEYYHIGIIDYLQTYNFSKQSEKVAKKIINLNSNLNTSSQDPKKYRKRFLTKMQEIIS